MKTILFLVALAATQVGIASKDVVVHPAPKEPRFLSAGWYPTLKAQVGAPPKANSPEQKKDEEALRNYQATRSTEDCQRAQSEVFVSLENFFGKPRGPLESATVKPLSDFFEQIRNDGDYFVQKLKKEFPRKRPFLYVKGIEPCVPKEVTDAYPSGHAVLSRLYALVLTDFFPEQKAAIEKRADQIAEDRILAGMHHPSDIATGRLIGEKIYAELQKSEKYQAELKRRKAGTL